MARKLKPLELGEVTHNKTNQKAKIFYDRERKVFCATVAETEYTDKAEEVLRNQVYNALGDFSGWKWETRIVVQLTEYGDHLYGHRNERHFDGRIAFTFWRVQVAKKPNGDEVERPYLNENGLTDTEQMFVDKDPKKHDAAWIASKAKWNREDQEEGHTLHHFHAWDRDDNCTKLLPYTDEVWQALHAIKARIDLAHLQLADLLKSKDLEQKLLNISMARPLAEAEKQLLLEAKRPPPEDDED